MKVKKIYPLLLSIVVFSLALVPSVHAETVHSQVWIYNSDHKLIKHYTHAKNKQKVHQINTIIGDAGGTAEDSSHLFPKRPKKASVKRIYKLTDYRKKTTVTIYANKTMYIGTTGINMVKVKLTNSQYKTLIKI